MKAKFKKLIIDDANFPLHRPGVYMLVEIESKKKYIGIGKDLYERLKDHDRGSVGHGKISDALAKYEFYCIPIFYQLEYNRKQLLDIEAKLISIYDCIKNGYNVIEKTEDCGFGEEFAKSCKEARNRPEVIEKHNNPSPETRRRRSEIQKDLWSNPAHSQARITSMRATKSTPEYKQKQSIILKEVLNRPEVKEKRARTLAPLHSSPEFAEEFCRRMEKYYSSHPGIRSLRKVEFYKIQENVEAAKEAQSRSRSRPGMKEMYVAMNKNPVSNAKRSTTLRNAYANGRKKFSPTAGKRWITNGENNCLIKEQDLLPDGWRYGKTHKNRKSRVESI